MAQSYWVYILLCNNGNYYTGYTIDLQRRFNDHVTGRAKCKYTRSFKPIKIAQSWQVSEASVAKRLECYIKKLSRQEKEKLILFPHLLLKSEKDHV